MKMVALERGSVMDEYLWQKLGNLDLWLNANVYFQSPQSVTAIEFASPTFLF